MTDSNTRSVLDQARWEKLPAWEVVEQTAEALRRRGFGAEAVKGGGEALARLREIIPEGASVMTSGTTLEQIGFTQLLASGRHPWRNLKGEILAEKDQAKQAGLRRSAIFADYMVGSVHAVTRDGEMVAGSASGSQLAAYVYGARNLILVVGAQKVTDTLEEGLRRLREHSTALEDRRMKSNGYPGTVLSKTLILERQTRPKVHVILVGEKLGF
jgi:LUD domain